MKKILLKSFLLGIALMLLKPPKVNAQPCPVSLFNNNTIVALANQTLYNTFAPGTYTVSFIHDLTFGCTEVFTIDMPVNKSANLMGVLGQPGSGGMGIYFDLAPYLNTIDPNCSGLPIDNGLWNGFVSIYIQQGGSAGPVIFSIDYTNNSVDQCFYPPLAVVWGTPFSATTLTGPKRVVLNWQTATESDVDHFSVEKSYDGSNWHKIAHIGAAGNSTSPQNYSHTDYNVADMNYYRVVAVDIDCSRDVSPIRLTRCPDNPFNPASNSCPSSFPAPGGLPVDCPAPPTLPYISGQAAICDNAAKLYRLNNMYGDAAVTWSFSPSYLATISSASKMVKVTPTGNTGVGTLTATVVKNGVTTYYSYSIVFGIPPLYGWCSSTEPDNCNGSTDFTATVSMLPGTHPYQYQWYSNGYYIGSGSTHTWYNVWPGQTVYFTVIYSGPCGQSEWSGSTMGCYMEAKTATRTKKSAQYKIAPNPARSDISIQRIPPCEEPPGPIEPQWKSASPVISSQPITIKVFDTQGRLRKTSRMSANSTKLSINGSDLPAGLYFVHIMEEGKETVTLKVLLEK